MVASLRETPTICVLANSPPLRMASATSPALPRPTPTRPRLSPTTTKALKLKRRPPLTTLAERLMKTTFSVSSCSRPSERESDESGDGRLRRPRKFPRPGARPSLLPSGFSLLSGVFGSATIIFSMKLELQTRLASGIGQGLDLSVKPGPAAIKNDFFNAFSQRGPGGQCAESLGASRVGGQLFPIRRRFTGRRSGGQRHPGGVIDELHV